MTTNIHAIWCKRQLLDLLAIIHRDGGHYVEDVGMDQEVKKAKEILAKYYLPTVQGKDID